jgi:hypothetical protein
MCPTNENAEIQAAYRLSIESARAEEENRSHLAEILAHSKLTAIKEEENRQEEKRRQELMERQLLEKDDSFEDLDLDLLLGCASPGPVYRPPLTGSPRSEQAIVDPVLHQAEEESHAEAEEPPQLQEKNFVTIPVPERNWGLVKKLALQFQHETGVGVTLNEYTRELELDQNGCSDEMMREACSIIEQWVDAPVMLREWLASISNERVHIFIDHSNLLNGCQEVVDDFGHKYRDYSVRVRFSALARLLTGGRDVQDRMVIGSSASREDALWRRWQDQGFVTHVQERLPGQKESFVDDALNLQMLHKICNSNSTAERRHTLVLLTGDGNANDGRVSFVEIVNQALLRHWKVEIWTWRACTSHRYLEYQASYMGLGIFSIIYLDDVREQITFISSKPARPSPPTGPRAPCSFPCHEYGIGPSYCAGYAAVPVPGLPCVGSNCLPGPCCAGQWTVSDEYCRDVRREFAVMVTGAAARSCAGSPEVPRGQGNERDPESEPQEDFSAFKCPITFDYLCKPVTAACGHTCEHSALRSWLDWNDACPVCGALVSECDLREPDSEFLDRLGELRRRKGLETEASDTEEP